MKALILTDDQLVALHELIDVATEVLGYADQYVGLEAALDQAEATTTGLAPGAEPSETTWRAGQDGSCCHH